MILDETLFKAAIKVEPLPGFELETYYEWAAENGTAINYAFGRLYFKEPEFAVLFKLRFGV